jgi:hypothetical protein
MALFSFSSPSIVIRVLSCGSFLDRVSDRRSSGDSKRPMSKGNSIRTVFGISSSFDSETAISSSYSRVLRNNSNSGKG